MTNAFVDPGLKLVARVTVKLSWRSENSKLLKYFHTKQYTKIYYSQIFNLKHLISF